MDLILDRVRKSFRDAVVVDDVSIRMQSGLYGLLGSNGAGKTTLMRMICTILKPTEGAIYYEGADVFEMNEKYRDILGYLPQEFGFYPELTVKDYLKYISALKGLRQAISKKRIDELLELTGMQKDSSKKMKELSGGMKRRVGIAQSLLNDPKILVLDEPTAGLDPMERIRFRNLIGQLSNDRIVLLSTHIVSDIEAIAKEVFVMKEGRIIDQGTIGELCRKLPCKVWIYREKTEEAESFVSRFVNPIGAIKTDGEYTQARILAEERPGENAICVDTTLEDVFLYHFGEIGGGSND
ncbi:MULTISPECIES: ABC transporter ATP-binding protein [Mogibacterium]|jgi:ABC superfamily ATP binding cassette transporter, ABC protein|uniref:ABC transporter, ATP-binding protein n=1 Tax=Mogibacterium timidum ATCC 33093 TaxID=1401079 RepID=X8J9K0_9FIRM|nr:MULTISPECIES: ABC transporter ATP-binding protein [Mogibacterium]EJU19634.1 ABC transporter, ATP-binding protein [Mogibacterium sp. CM50]EUC59966.1 ABC transporter, ATP-binding protein [Mogibacterium timidum ATCC 33093]